MIKFWGVISLVRVYVKRLPLQLCYEYKIYYDQVKEVQEKSPANPAEAAKPAPAGKS